MNKILDILSVTGSFLVAFGLLFWLQDITIGRINLFKDLMAFDVIKFKHLLFTATSIIVISAFINFYSPDRNKNKGS